MTGVKSSGNYIGWDEHNIVNTPIEAMNLSSLCVKVPCDPTKSTLPPRPYNRGMLYLAIAVMLLR